MAKPLWLPDAIRKPIPQTSTDPDIIPIGDIFHVAVSKSDSLHDLFEHDGGIESTGYIRFDGKVEQYRPFTVECDAQFDGNSWIGGDGRRYGFNSWESEGMGDGEWTDAQIATIKAIIRFKHREWGHPLRKCPAWNMPGYGYHCLFERWNKTAHSCPGPARVNQFNNIIVPWLRQGAPQEDDMPTPADLWNYQIPVYDNSQKDAKAAAHVVLSQAHNRAGDARSAARAALDGVHNLAKLLSAIGNSSLSQQEISDIAKQVSDEVETAVKEIDAAAVAEELEIQVKPTS